MLRTILHTGLTKKSVRAYEGHARVDERSGEIPMSPLRTITASYPNKIYSFHVEHLESVSVAADVDAWDDPSCNVAQHYVTFPI